MPSRGPIGMTKNITESIVTHHGNWVIDEESNISIECYVTSNKKRILSLRGTARMLDLKGAGSTAITRNLKAQWIQPYLTDGLKEWLRIVESGNIEKIGGTRGANFIPLESSLFVDICKVYVNAQRDGRFADKNNNVLPKWKKQNLIAHKLYGVLSAFAKVGIVALIDEITGYQEDRDRNALHKLLSVYLAEERLVWAKVFPDEFYKQIYRLKGWRYPTGSTKRSPLIGKITNEIVYKRLPEGVLEKLKNRNPLKPGTKRRKWKHHQFLSEDIGQPDLRDHLLQGIALMRASSNWNGFIRLLYRALPKPGDQIPLDMENPIDD